MPPNQVNSCHNSSVSFRGINFLPGAAAGYPSGHDRGGQTGVPDLCCGLSSLLRYLGVILSYSHPNVPHNICWTTPTCFLPCYKEILSVNKLHRKSWAVSMQVFEKLDFQFHTHTNTPTFMHDTSASWARNNCVVQNHALQKCIIMASLANAYSLKFFCCYGHTNTLCHSSFVSQPYFYFEAIHHESKRQITQDVGNQCSELPVFSFTQMQQLRLELQVWKDVKSFLKSILVLLPKLILAL